MALTTTLATCDTNPALNGPAGSDLPATLDDQIRYALSFIAQLRDGGALPVGMVAPFATTAAPSGWLKMNGALVSRATYAALFAFATGSGLVSEAAWTAGASGQFSVGDGSTTFRLPDLRGVGLRGLDESRGLDVSRAFGSYQADQNASHTHGVTDPTHAHGVADPAHNHGGTTDTQGSHQHAFTGTQANSGAGAFSGATTVYGLNVAVTDPAGAHAHNVVTSAAATGISIYASGTGVSIQSQGGDGRGKNIAYPFYIKF